MPGGGKDSLRDYVNDSFEAKNLLDPTPKKNLANEVGGRLKRRLNIFNFDSEAK